MEKTLAKIYYQLKNLWKGQKAIEKCNKVNKVSSLKNMLKVGYLNKPLGQYIYLHHKR